MIQGILKSIGNTPMVNVYIDGCIIKAKLEYLNPFGSMKDRAALGVINNNYDYGFINDKTTIIESSSGNFAIALSGVCASMNLNCICVVDNNITPSNKKIIEQYGSKLICVNTREKNQSFQERRIEEVKKYINSNSNTYWSNQYNNELIPKAYFSLAKEILNQFSEVERIYLPVSTCGTIAGVSSWIKSNKSSVEIIAVDSYGSQIFGERIARNRFTGMGSRIIPGNIKSSIIDRIIRVSDYECLTNCQFLLKQGFFVGASSGAVIAAIKKDKGYIKNTATIFPDRGDRYMDNLYSEKWVNDNLTELIREDSIVNNLL